MIVDVTGQQEMLPGTTTANASASMKMDVGSQAKTQMTLRSAPSAKVIAGNNSQRPEGILYFGIERFQ